MNPLISIVPKFGKVSINISIDQVLSEIANGSFRQKIVQIQSLNSEGKFEEASIIKKSLPSFTISGQFKGSHRKENLTVFSGIIILDFDNIPPELYDQVFTNACSIKTTLGCFRSPSGNGIKVLVPISGGPENFENYYLQVAEFYRNKLEWDFDSRCKDISRLCFFSYDPYLYKNLECNIFQVESCPITTHDEIEIQEFPESKLTQEQPENLFKKAVLKTRKICKYEDGNRNNFIFLLACNCAREGISLIDAQKSIFLKYDLDKAEMVTTINSAYENKKQNTSYSITQKESLFSINLLNLMKYKPEIESDKRVFFEALIIKAINFGGVFYLTIAMIKSELGIRRNRAEALINEFKELGLISVQPRTFQEDGRPRKMTYYTLYPERIIETSTLLFKDNKEFVRRIAYLLSGDTFNQKY